MLSVIVPVYNVEDYVSRCIRSICEQKLNNLEIIVVDDGSTDSSGSICDEYAISDSRIRVYHTDNKGVSNARNFGLKLARGEYVTFVDSDDWIDKNMYELLFDDIKRNSADIGVATIIKTRNSKLITRKIPNKGVLVDIETAVKRMFSPTQEIFFGCNIYNKIYKADLVRNVKFREDLVCAEDFLFMWEVLKKNPSITYNNSTNYYYYQRDDSVCNQTKNYKIYRDNYVVSQLIYEDIFFDENIKISEYKFLKYLDSTLNLHYFNFEKADELRALIRKNILRSFLNNYLGKKAKIKMLMLFLFSTEWQRHISKYIS